VKDRQILDGILMANEMVSDPERNNTKLYQICGWVGEGGSAPTVVQICLVIVAKLIHFLLQGSCMYHFYIESLF
jgi:hypothetical protein